MEVQGRKACENYKIGDFCKICKADDYHVPAFGYCKNCKLNLCRKCFDAHNRDKRSSYHNTERSDPVNAKDPLPFCSKHENDEIDYYCRAHEDLCCNKCMIQHHKDCETDYIPDVSTQFTVTEEYLNIDLDLNVLKRRISEVMNIMKKNTDKCKEFFQIATENIRAVKRKIIDSLDKFERELEKEALDYKKASDEQMAKIKIDLDDLENEISHTAIAMSELKVQSTYNMQFIEAKNAKKKMSNYFERMYEISTRNYVQNMTFCPSNKIYEICTTGNLLGAIELECCKLGPCNTSEILETGKQYLINIRSESDKKICYATGLAFLSVDQLAIADKANKNVKIVDVSHHHIVSQIELTSSPRDITVIPPDQLAVTLRDEERIQLLSTRKGLIKGDQILTTGNCRGIKYDDGKLIVAFDGKVRPKIEIMRLTGEVLCTFQLNEYGSMIFKEPKGIGLSPDSNRMYVTDLSKMCVFRLSRMGNVTATFGRHRYMGLAASAGGSVYACSKSGNSVFKFPEDLSNDETVLTINDGIKAPIGLAISNAKHMLYISCGSNDAGVSNKLHAFKIKPIFCDYSTDEGSHTS